MRLIVTSLVLSAVMTLGQFAAAAPSATTVSILNYGAKGDGAADDRAAIQRAIDAVSAAGGGTVMIPPGTYRVAAPPREDRFHPIVLRMLSNVAIVGSGDASVIKLDPLPQNQETIWVLATCDPQKSWCTGPTTGVRIESLVIDGSRAGQPTKNGRESEHMHGVFLVSASDVQIRRLTVRDMAGDGIYTYRENSRVLVERSTFQRIRRVGINFAGTSDSVAQDNSITGAQWALKMELDGPATRSVSGNQFRRNVARNVFGGVSVTKSDERQLATHARAGNIVIADNDFQITSDHADRIGINLWGVDGVRVTGNTVTGNIMQGLFVWDDATDVRIEGNTFSTVRGSPGAAAASASCIRLGGRDASTADIRSVFIAGNTLSVCRVGVRLARPGSFQLINVAITANTFNDHSVAGILVDSATGIMNLSITGNTFRQTPSQIVRR